MNDNDLLNEEQSGQMHLQPCAREFKVNKAAFAPGSLVCRTCRGSSSAELTDRQSYNKSSMWLTDTFSCKQLALA